MPSKYKMGFIDNCMI